MSVRVTASVTFRKIRDQQPTLGAIEVAFEIWSNERPLPLYKSHLRELRFPIYGGVFPGETLTSSDYHFMTEREKEMARQAKELSVRFAVEWVKDVNGNRLTCDLQPR